MDQQFRFDAYAPPPASWLNLVVRCFAVFTRQLIRDGVFRSVDKLQMAINDYLDSRHADSTPSVWPATARGRPSSYEASCNAIGMPPS